MNRPESWAKALGGVATIGVTSTAALVANVKVSFAWTAPTLDDNLDSVYREYGTISRYSDTNTHEPTRVDNYAAAHLYVFEDANLISVFYCLDILYANNGSYCENSIHWESRVNGKRNFFDLYESDNGEFNSKDSGGEALWAPTGLSLNSDARSLGKAFSSPYFKEERRVMEDAIPEALRGYQPTRDGFAIPEMFTLLGDPATRMKVSGN